MSEADGHRFGSQIQYGSQASLLLTTPHFRHTKIKHFQ